MVSISKCSVGDLTVRISKADRIARRVSRGGQSFSLANGPRLAVGNATLTSIVTKQDGSDCVVTATYDGGLKSVTWRVRRSNGWVQCDYTYAVSGTNDYFGVMFDYPENLVKGKRWLGMGPYRVWKNRLRGGTLGVWENNYNNTITGWRDWIYPEFKGCFANVRWMQLETTEGPITDRAGSHRPVRAGAHARVSADERGGQNLPDPAARRAGVARRHPAHRQQVQGRDHHRPARTTKRGQR